MRTRAKIRIIGIAIVLAVLGIVMAGANYWLTCLVRRQLDQNIAMADSMEIRYGKVSLSIVTGHVSIGDVYFKSDSLPWDSSVRPVTEAMVDEIALKGINYYDWLVNREVSLRGFEVKNPMIRTRFVHTPKDQFQGLELKSKMDEERRQRLEKAMRVIRLFVDGATVGEISVENAQVDAEALNDSLRIAVPNCTMHIYDIGYSLADSSLQYNDSSFHFLAKQVAVRMSDVDLSLHVGECSVATNGVLQVCDAEVHGYLDSLHREPLEAEVERIYVGGFDAAAFDQRSLLRIRNVHVYNPKMKMLLDEKAAQARQQKSEAQWQTTKQNLEQFRLTLDEVSEYITGLDIDTIMMHDGCFEVQSVRTDLYAKADSVSTAVYDIGYSLIDKIPYHYNDSVYAFRLASAHMVTPDSLIAISTSRITYENGHSFEVGPTHVRHLVEHWDLAHRMHDVPSSWIDLKLNSAHTSSKNILKEVFTVKERFYLDTLYADVDYIHVFRDERCQPDKPYSLPQKALIGLTYPFVIHEVRADINRVHVDLALTEKSVGAIDLNNLKVKVNNVTAIPNSVIAVSAEGRLGKGNVHADLEMTVNAACDWRIALRAEHLNLHCLDDMLYPVVGMKVGCNIKHLTADYAGDSAVATGTFCMEYDSLHIHAFRENNSPFTIVGDLSGVINSVGNTLLKKANPAIPGKQPTAYQVKWKNDVWVNPALFYMGPVINGCIETLLPGLFLHRRVKDNAATSLPRTSPKVKHSKRV